MVGRTLYERGEGIERNKITVQCRNYPFGKQPIQGTSRDKLQRGSLEGTVYYVIAKPVRSLRKRAQHFEYI